MRIGLALLCLSYALFVAFAFVLFGSNVAVTLAQQHSAEGLVHAVGVETGATFFDRAVTQMANDNYYRFLVPATLPVTLVFVYLSWMGLKLFRHNR